MSDLLKAALYYAKLGWHVFPCAPGQKVPLTAHGVLDATTDPETITKWWFAQPKANVAMACGQVSGVHVCDIDVDDQKSGWDSLKKHGFVLPDTIMQRTPSGGAHLFYRADHPPANKNSFLPGVDIRSDGYYVVMAPSVHPNGGIYEWAAGHAPGDLEAAPWPSCLRPTQKPIEPPEALPGHVRRQEPSQDGVLERASAYLAMCDPAMQGFGGHDKLLWAAVCMVHGFLLSDDQAFNLLAHEYNPRCVPPWDLSLQKDDRDFRRKIQEARRLTPQMKVGWLLNEEEYVVPFVAPMSAADAERFIENSSPSTQIIEDDAPEEDSRIRDDPEWTFLTQPTGLLGDICSWINKTALREQPLLALGTALSFCGTLFGRKIKDERGLRSNLYCMGVGQSSAGKNHSVVQIRSLCFAACCLDLLGGDDFASDASIEARLTKFPATLFLLDEVGHLMSFARHSNNTFLQKIIPLLMKLYSSSGDVYLGREYAEEGKQRMIMQPCCCIWGTTTPEEFTPGLSSRDLRNGWLSRCLVFRTDDMPDKARILIDQSPPESIVERVAEWFFKEIERPEGAGLGSFVKQRYGSNAPMPPAQIVVPATSEANKIFAKFDNDSVKMARKFPDTDCLWSKVEENARKIALIVAASEDSNSPKITPAIADYSCRLIYFLLLDFCNHIALLISDTAIDDKKKKILAVIRSARMRGCTKRDLTRATQSWFTGKDRSVLLADLIEAGEVYTEIQGQKVVFRTESNHQKYLRKLSAN